MNRDGHQILALAVIAEACMDMRRPETSPMAHHLGYRYGHQQMLREAKNFLASEWLDSLCTLAEIEPGAVRCVLES